MNLSQFGPGETCCEPVCEGIFWWGGNGLSFYNPLAVGEMETGGHVFQVTFMNSTAVPENQFIPYTTTRWEKGQFRCGFIISRTFSLTRKKK